MSDALANVFGNLIEVMLTGGPAVVATLILAIFALIMDRRRLLRNERETREKVEQIVDQYHSGTMRVHDAIESLKAVIFQVR